jgi:methionyl-tRNA formyltransferase
LRGEAAAVALDSLDALIVAAYGLILPASILRTPRHGCINVHASLLPRWRGAAPIERAMMAGDPTTGVSIMQMDEGLDTGPVLVYQECSILPNDTGDSLRERLATIGARAVLGYLDRWVDIRANPQPEAGATYATKLTPADSDICWSDTALELANRIRALNSRQPAFSFCGGERIRLLFAEPMVGDSTEPPGTVIAIDRTGLIVSCGSGQLRVTRVALNRGSGKPMDVASLLSGRADLIRPGQVLGSPT